MGQRSSAVWWPRALTLGPAAQCKAQCNHLGQVDSPLCATVASSGKGDNRSSDLLELL